MIIVGGGAAGMMTAIFAAENYKVTLLEKNEKLGKKLFITGKGRCNLTNDCDEETFLKNVMSNPKFLYSAIYSLNSEQVMKYFTDWGLSIKTERGNRVFPTSDHSSDVIRTLEREMERRGVKVRLNTKVSRILTVSSESSEKVTGVRLATGEELCADVVVLATGGVSYSGTGASGECVTMLEKLGIDVRPFQPSLVPFESDLSICKPLMAGDVAVVGFLSFRRFHLGLNNANRQTEEHVDFSHPFHVSTSQIVVDCNDVNAAPFQSV